MRFVVGLGNPGRRYDRTPHNVGFAVVDRLAAQVSMEPEPAFRRKFKADYLEGALDGERIYLVKPVTYMNLSGPAVQGILGYFKGDRKDLLVVHDDIDLPLGRLRFRARGSSGGHRGVDSIIESLGDGAFARLKIGVGRGETGEPSREAADYVTSRYPACQQATYERVLDRATDAVRTWIREGFEGGAQRFNGDEPDGGA